MFQTCSDILNRLSYPKDVYNNDGSLLLPTVHQGSDTSSAEYFTDIAQAYREEIAELYSVGCRNIQARISSLHILFALPRR